MEKEREDKILEAIGRQRDDIVAHMDKQFSSAKEDLTVVREDLTTVKSELNSVKTAVLENSKGIKDNGIKIDRVERKLDTAVTNHEGRMRKLEEKVSI